MDRFGRKPALYAGLIVYILAAAGCALATSIDGLILMRVIQAIGSCAAAVASVAMVRDFDVIPDVNSFFENRCVEHRYAS